MTCLLSQNQIKQLIPHRYPILILDEILEYTPSKRILAYAYLGSDEQVFRGHFPSFPILPGVFLVEGLAQASSVFLELNHQAWNPGNELIPNPGNGMLGVLGSAETRFKHPVFPDSEVFFEAVTTREFSNSLFMKVRAYYGDKTFVSGTISVTKVHQKVLARNSDYETIY